MGLSMFSLCTLSVLCSVVFTYGQYDRFFRGQYPAFVHVNRHWRVLTTDPIGTVVTKVRTSRNGVAVTAITYELETSGVPVPFAIDRLTGLVTVNDSLDDKANQDYDIWVLANETNAILQKIEVKASVQIASALPSSPETLLLEKVTYPSEKVTYPSEKVTYPSEVVTPYRNEYLIPEDDETTAAVHPAIV
ncbi:hypothetical protein O0L34_g11203 [Tuta absoluta]|nr:hypothetical protein O0L34_g11203 [Tuta absoluta]